MKIENFKTATFEQDVLQSSAPVLIDFWAPWCTHCRVLNPMLEVFAGKMDRSASARSISMKNRTWQKNSAS